MHLQLVDHFLQIVGLNLAGHDLHHLLADLADLLVLGIRGLSDLVGALLCETHTEKTQEIAVGGLHIHMGFDHSLRTKIINIYIGINVSLSLHICSASHNSPVSTNTNLS